MVRRHECTPFGEGIAKSEEGFSPSDIAEAIESESISIDCMDAVNPSRRKEIKKQLDLGDDSEVGGQETLQEVKNE